MKWEHVFYEDQIIILFFQHHISVSNQVQITMIHRLDLTFPYIMNWNEQWAWNLRIWWDFVTLWLMQLSGKFVKYSICASVSSGIRSDGDTDEIPTYFSQTGNKAIITFITQIF